MKIQLPEPGAVIQVRSTPWKVSKVTSKKGFKIIKCKGISGITKGKVASFVFQLESSLKILDPAEISLVPDQSSGIVDTKLYLAASFRSTPTTSRKPLTLGRAAIDDLSFQHLPVEMALKQDRVRLLIADDVGLGKTLEAGLIASELALRGRANRILVVTTRSMLVQFQKEIWTRFSIPLARLDSAAIRRMRNRIPAHYNVFDEFERSIVSIDTLKRDSQIRAAIEDSYWDLIIIDEAHNSADRSKNSGKTAQRAKLAQLLARKSDSLLLLTATPHDGSQESFASLIRMLDPTRVPDVEKLKREDIEDLVVRRFRSSPAVIDALKTQALERRLVRNDFDLSPEEEAVYESIADLSLDLDEEQKSNKAIDLFRTTLAKSIFSSPEACRQTLDSRIKRIHLRTARGTDSDVAKLESLLAQVKLVDTSSFKKYQKLLELFSELKWNGKKPRDRFVIFSERIATVSWLSARLKQDLGLTDEQIGRVDGGSVDADNKTQQVLEDFGQEKSPLRILICSDMASEGLNLHFQCHRLIHFDLPWSLLRFQQRNGRIDRYGQDRHPEIYYFVAATTHPKIRQMWVLDKLVEKDEAARQGVGDPAVFLNAGDVDSEEAKVAEFISGSKGPEALEQFMDNNLATVSEHHEAVDEFDLLFGDYSGGASLDTSAEIAPEPELPRLFPDTFTYTSKMLTKLGNPALGLFDAMPAIAEDNRYIRFKLPDDMRATDTLGYARNKDVDERFMPVEALPNSEDVELTDDVDLINHAIDRAKSEERAWPAIQFLWEGHTLLQWFAEQADTFFPDHSAPVASLAGRLDPNEVVLILHGAIPNAKGAPVIDRWLAVSVKQGSTKTEEIDLLVQGEIKTEEINHFIDRVGLDRNIPSKTVDNPEQYRGALCQAVDHFQTLLVKLRKERTGEIEQSLEGVLDRLSSLEEQYFSQLDHKFEAAEGETLPRRRGREMRLEKQKKEISQLFDDWSQWFEETRRMVDDPNPYVDVRAVFVG
jgi:superfamily II DNA or RNA helicase